MCPLVTRQANQGVVFRQATEPSEWLNGDLWIDTDDGSIFVNVSGTATPIMTPQNTFLDNQNATFGTGSDATIDYNGTNLVINPKVVGSGNLTLSGDLTLTGIMRSSPTDLTITTGQVTVTRNNHRIDTEASASTDDLDGMGGGAEGMQISLSTVDGARDITVRDATGSNQFDLSTAGNFTMDTIFDVLFVVYRSTGTSRVWLEVSRSSNV